MRVTVNGTNSTEIEDSVVERVLDQYPEEELATRNVFEEAFSNGTIEFSDLKEESDKILIPWQMFFLTTANLNQQLTHIDTVRQHKVSAKLVAKRRGTGDVTSKRIVDRLIRQQNFLTAPGTFPSNTFCGSLTNVPTKQAAKQILTHFDISQDFLWRYRGKGRALEYLIRKVESGNINVSRGVLTNKLLPTWQVVPSDVYRNTSGFVVKDDCVPFVFLPNEVNPDEVESRQIYTLVYLIAVIGLGQYDYYLDKDFKAKMLGATGMNARLHAITTELLMPESETDKLRGQTITAARRDELADTFKVSPSALVITLCRRGVITRKQFDALKPPPYVPKKRTNSHTRSPKVSTSVKKFCGEKSFNAINAGIRTGTLKSIQAQYLIFGAVNKKGYRKYRNELGI